MKVSYLIFSLKSICLRGALYKKTQLFMAMVYENIVSTGLHCSLFSRALSTCLKCWCPSMRLQPVFLTRDTFYMGPAVYTKKSFCVRLIIQQKHWLQMVFQCLNLKEPVDPKEFRHKALLTGFCHLADLKNKFYFEPKLYFIYSSQKNELNYFIWFRKKNIGKNSEN